MWVDLRPPGNVLGIPAPFVRDLFGIGGIRLERMGREISPSVGEVGLFHLAILEDGGRDLRDKGEAEDGQSRQRQHGSDMRNALLPSRPG